MNTRRHPRTLVEAFGPYTSNAITEQDSKDYSAAWWAYFIVTCMAAALVIASTL